MAQSIDVGRDPHEWAVPKIKELVPEKSECGLTVYHTEWGAFCRVEEAEAIVKELKAENRMLKRALWLARLRALRNFSVLAYFQTLRAKGKESNMDFNEMAYRIDLTRVKCRAKAEEYK